MVLRLFFGGLDSAVCNGNRTVKAFWVIGVTGNITNTLGLFFIDFNAPQQYEDVMTSSCAFCDKTRTAFIWVIAFGIIANAGYNFFYMDKALTVFQIVKIPLLFCILALIIKAYRSWNK